MDKNMIAVRTYDKIAQAYADTFNKPSEHIDEFLELIRKKGKILDVGCGPGVDASYIFSKGFSVTAIDLSKEMIRLAKKRYSKINFIAADMRDFHLKPDSFDGIAASYSLTFVPKADIPRVLARLYRSLKRGGPIYIAVQAGKSQELFLPEPLKPDEKMFLNIFSAGEIKKLLRYAGFSVLIEYRRKAKTKEEFEFNFMKLFIIAKK